MKRAGIDCESNLDPPDKDDSDRERDEQDYVEEAAARGGDRVGNDRWMDYTP